MQLRTGLWLVVMLAACGDDGAGTPVDSGRPDAPADASYDADPSIAPLVGTWAKAPESWSGQMITLVTFRPDGTVRTAGGNTSEEGTYSVPSPGRLKLVFGTSTRESNFVVANGRILIDAMLPEGTVNGFVGTWKTSFLQNSAMGTVTLVVMANNTAAYTFGGPTGSQTWNGTWATDGTGFVFDATTPSAITIHFRPIGSQGIGSFLFAKQ